jgi:hypothetical protein
VFKGCFAVENDAVGRNRSLKVKDTRACFGPCLGQNGAPSALRMVGLIFFTVAGWWCRCIRAKDCISIVLRIFSARSASTFAVSRNSVGRWTRKSGQQYRGRWQHGYRRSPCSRCQGYAPGAPDDAPLPTEVSAPDRPAHGSKHSAAMRHLFPSSNHGCGPDCSQRFRQTSDVSCKCVDFQVHRIANRHAAPGRDGLCVRDKIDPK